MSDIFMEDMKYQNATFYSRYFIEVAEEDITFKDLIVKYLLQITKKGTANIYHINITVTLSAIVDTVDISVSKESDRSGKNSGQKSKKQKKCLAYYFLGYNINKYQVINDSNCLEN